MCHLYLFTPRNESRECLRIPVVKIYPVLNFSNGAVLEKKTEIYTEKVNKSHNHYTLKIVLLTFDTGIETRQSDNFFTGVSFYTQLD